jgi:hypothetical protein
MLLNARACATSKKEKSLFMPPKAQNLFSLFRLDVFLARRLA